ncbi:MAG TPA: orotate phosphoribosyltransferase [Polyangiaceae bacterium]|nr:orotate phosphoribosyltransferase [Polyangiaceae bacterium]
MEAYKQEFVEFMVRSQVLQFGDFVTKSGRKTPFFINTGRYKTGSELARLGRFYAEALIGRLGTGYDTLFGPAYKGIPLVVTTAMALAEHQGHDVGFCFNRKEAKDHGEGGVLVGRPLRDGDRVVIVEDVTTAGTSVRETLPLLRAAANIQIAGLIVSVDRMERGSGELNALAEIRQTIGAPAFSIVTIDEVTRFLHGRKIDGKVVVNDDDYAKIQVYRREYGGKEA